MSSLLEKMILEDIDWLTNDLVAEGKRLKAELGKLLFNFEAFFETGDVAYLHKELGKGISVEENSGSTNPKKGRPKRGVLAEINDTNILSNGQHIRIKTEKISNAYSNSNNLTQISQKSYEITENSIQGEMPPPSQVLPKKRKIKKEPVDGPTKRSTRTKRKPERYTYDETSYGKESDVIIQNPEIVTIDVSNDSEKEHENTNTSNILKQDEPFRSKRTRTIKKKDAEPNVNEYMPVNQEKAATVQPSNFNATYTANTSSSLINNCTVVLEKINLNEKMETVSKQTPQKIQKNKKEIFSPFDKVSTKKKVEAFEKLVIPTSTPISNKNVEDKKNKEESKQITPMTSKIPSKTNSTTKINKFAHIENSCDKSSLISSKSQSALKASQAEFRERLKKKQEKEEEALRKREAMLLALTEEKRKKREEKQLKAQQQRELIEKEKLKLMEMQKLKEEKQRQALAEREEKIQQQKEEARKKEEIKLKDKNPKLQSGRPIYMITQAPLLPTDDCYDTDEEGTSKDQKREVPNWSKDRELYKMQYLMIKAGEALKNTFFCRQIYTPNLQDIFEEIDPRKLKRTSSAIWRKPPRYTIFLESSTVQFSEDDEN